MSGEDAEHALLVAVSSGLLMRSVAIGGSNSGCLLGPGEIATLRVAQDSYLPQQASWNVLAPARVAVIDVATAAELPSWSRTSKRLVDHLDDQLRRACELIAIGHLPRVEDRVLAFMLHLAERYGRVGPDGVIVPIDITHSIIGQMIGARRPTVSLALRHLAEDGLMSRGHDGRWTLGDGCREALGARAPTTRVEPAVAAA